MTSIARMSLCVIDHREGEAKETKPQGMARGGASGQATGVTGPESPWKTAFGFWLE